MNKIGKFFLFFLLISTMFVTGIDSSFAGSDVELLKSLGFDFVLDSAAKNSKKNSQGYNVFGMGIAVDDSCYKVYPKNKMPDVIQKMLVQGLACMKKVERGENSKRDIESFRKMLLNKANPPKLECDKDLPDSAFAIGSSPGHSRRHPYILLAAFANKKFSRETEFFQGVVFHEMLHNIRYFHHPDDLEVTSSCEECCFGKLDGAKKEAACRVCGGAFETLDDPDYIKSLLVWDGKFYGRVFAEEKFVKSYKDPAILKSLEFKNAVNAFVSEISNPVKSDKALVMIEQIAAGEFEKVEVVLKALPDIEGANRARFFFYRLMSFSMNQKGDLAQEKAYQALAESFRKKYI